MEPVPRPSDNKGMSEIQDYYEILQISPNAEPDTVHRVYRLLAQRFHPDNAETGDDGRFRQLAEAYQVLGDPERRAQYDVIHTNLKQERWRLISANQHAGDDFESEQLARLMILELLYIRRRTEFQDPGLSLFDLESLTGRAREHLQFTIWFLTQKKYVTRSDDGVTIITADGVEYLEKTSEGGARQRRLNAVTEPVVAGKTSAP
jgi:curved DNA-binding protein CbpA